MKQMKRRFYRLLDLYRPVFCWVCRGLFFNKDVTYEQNTVGSIVPLCDSCHKKLFRPFSME